MLEIVVSSLVTLAATLLAVFLTPLGERLIGSKLLGAPHFVLDSHELKNHEFLYVRSRSRSVRRTKRLGVKLGGVLLPELGEFTQRAGSEVTWRFNMLDPKIPRSVFDKSEPVKIHVFAEANRLGEELALFVTEEFRVLLASKWITPQATVRSVKELVAAIGSNRRLNLTEKLYIIEDSPVVDTQNVHWSEVFDGREWAISEVSNLVITSDEYATIRANALYSWVFQIDTFSRVEISSLQLDHRKPGQCQGGVLRATRGLGLVVQSSILAGSGTYGLQIDRCGEVRISDTTIRECSYGIAIVEESQDILFQRCAFHGNGRFDLFQFSGANREISFRECVFKDNNWDDSSFLFKFAFNTSGAIVSFYGCTFEGNRGTKLSNQLDRLSFSDCRFVANKFPSPSD